MTSYRSIFLYSTEEICTDFDLAYLFLHDYSAYLQENVRLVDCVLNPDRILTVSEAIDWIRTQILIALGF